jgi:hypothetical protein
MNIAWGDTWFWNIGDYLVVVGIGPCLGGKVGGDEPDDPRGRSAGTRPGSQYRVLVMKPCSVAIASGWPTPNQCGRSDSR